MVSISEFKARNAEAQRINAEIQKAQGAREEHKRMFEKLCSDYEAAYGEKITADNLESVLNRVAAEVEAQAEAQAAAIERAKTGVVVPKTPTSGTTEAQSATGVAGNTGVQSAQSATGGVGATGVQAQHTPVQPQVNLAQTPVAGAQNITQPAVQPQANPAQGIAQPTFGIPTQGTVPTAQPIAEAPAPKPVSAAALSAAALAQSNTQPTLTQPDLTQPASKPIQATVNIPGWTPQAAQGTVPTAQNLGVTTQPTTQVAPQNAQKGTPEAPDFSKILGGSFGG